MSSFSERMVQSSSFSVNARSEFGSQTLSGWPFRLCNEISEVFEMFPGRFFAETRRSFTQIIGVIIVLIYFN